MKILVTGCAGFIGFHLCKNLFKKKNYVFGIDNLNTYYDLQLKNDRLSILKKNQSFKFFKLDISDTVKLRNLFKKNNFDVVINLAAQAGVRFSIQNPKTYFESNILGFYNILFFSKEFKVKHLLYASTSSVYGDPNFFPTIETNDTDKPLSFYAASKKTNEVMAHAFSNIYKLNTTGLRFFTVYGPYGRPDMAIYKFTNAIRKNISLELYNKGNHYRDFTYVDDVIYHISKILNLKKTKKEKIIPFRIFNIGNSKTEKITKIIRIIENHYNKTAKIKNVRFQKGDVYKTFANINKISKLTKIKKRTSLDKGIGLYLNWFDKYYE